MKISIICVGKIKENYWGQAIAEYSKRLSSYCRLEIKELADEKTPDGCSAALRERILQTEGSRILDVLRGDEYVIALAIDGRRLDSERFAGFVDRLGVEGKSHIAFVIGGSLGLDEKVFQRSDFKLSFSDMTFPHQLMRVILLEQIYRAYRIINGQPYHK